jgi:hypothetical protein
MKGDKEVKTRLKPFLASFAIFTLLVIQFTPVIAWASISPWQGNPWEGKEWEGNPWEGKTWEGNTFENDSWEKESFSKDAKPVDPNNPVNPGDPKSVDPVNPGDPANPNGNNPDSDSADQPPGTDGGGSKDTEQPDGDSKLSTWDGIKWTGQIFTDQFAFASKMLQDQATMEWNISRGELAEDMTMKNLKYLGLDTALLFAKNISKGTIMETPFDMAYDGRDIAKNVSPAVQAFKDSWGVISKSKIGQAITGGRGVFNPNMPSSTPLTAPVPSIVSKLNVGVAAVGTVMGGIDTVKSFQEGKTVDGIGNLGSTLMNAGVVAAAIPGAQAAAPFIIAGGAILYGGAMVVKHSDTIAKAAKKTWDYAKKGAKAIGDGLSSVAKGIGSLFG